MKLINEINNILESNKDLDNLKPNWGLTYDEWKKQLVDKYGKKVKFVSYDVPATSRSAIVKGEQIGVYTFPHKK